MSVHRSDSEERTLSIGRAVGEALRPPRVVLISGDLGSGKTVLVKGICMGLGVEDPRLVHSPTFSLVHRYRSRRSLIHHVDLYRLDTPREVYSIGIEEILAEEAIVLVEWAEKLPLRVDDPVLIRIRVLPEGMARTIEITGLEEASDGPKYPDS